MLAGVWGEGFVRASIPYSNRLSLLCMDRSMAFVPVKEENEGEAVIRGVIVGEGLTAVVATAVVTQYLASFIVQCQAFFALLGYSHFADGETEAQSGCTGSDSEYKT